MNEKKEGSVKRATKDNADTAGISLGVILAWAIPTFTGIDIPIEVATAAGGILGAVGARLRD
jgi:small basic protein